MGYLIKSESEITELKTKILGEKLILTNGCFDILHIGHLRYLQAAKSLGDYLLIGVNSDSSVKALKGATRPLNNQFDRAEILNGLNCVDFTYIFPENTAEKLIDLVRPDAYVKGGDYKLENLPEYKILNELKIEVIFLSFINGYSTTSLIQKVQL
jgi:D-glycero-beta-D-manno-heptose 1-phosphate adenylyltransferase